MRDLWSIKRNQVQILTSNRKYKAPWNLNPVCIQGQSSMIFEDEKLDIKRQLFYCIWNFWHTIQRKNTFLTYGREKDFQKEEGRNAISRKYKPLGSIYQCLWKYEDYMKYSTCTNSGSSECIQGRYPETQCIRLYPRVSRSPRREWTPRKCTFLFFSLVLKTVEHWGGWVILSLEFKSLEKQNKK